MKITVDIPEDLYRAAKAKAALEGRRLTDIVAEGLRLALNSPVPKNHRVSFPLIKGEPGDPIITNQQVDDAEQAILDDEARRAALCTAL